MASAISTVLPSKFLSVIFNSSNTCSFPFYYSISSLHCDIIWVSASNSCGHKSRVKSNVNVKSKASSSSYMYPLHRNRRSPNFICRAAEYKFPDPIPEFAVAETEKFRAHLLEKLSKKDMFGDEVEEVVGICTEIFSTFLHTEYGGPGTLLVQPFADMADALNEEGLPGAPQASRVAIKWAQNHVDKDWKEWTSI